MESNSAARLKAELIEHNVSGGFDAGNFALLTKKPRLIDTLANQLLETHFPASLQNDIADELGFDIQHTLSQRDPKFRQMVLRAYNYQCAICGFNMRHDRQRAHRSRSGAYSLETTSGSL